MNTNHFTYKKKSDRKLNWMFKVGICFSTLYYFIINAIYHFSNLIVYMIKLFMALYSQVLNNNFQHLIWWMLRVEFCFVDAHRWTQLRPDWSPNLFLPSIYAKIKQMFWLVEKFFTKSEWQSKTYFRLHSMFIWLNCDIASIIWSLVVSFNGWLVFKALVGVGTTGAWIGPVVGGTGAIGLNAVLTWAVVNWLTCKISFLMQNPLPIGTMTIERWNERKSLRTDVDLDCFSRKIPVTVSIIIAGYSEWKKNQIRMKEIE